MHFQETPEIRLNRTKIHFFSKGSKNQYRELPEVRKNYKLINILDGEMGEVTVMCDEKLLEKSGSEATHKDIEQRSSKNIQASTRKINKRKNNQVDKESGGETRGKESKLDSPCVVNNKKCKVLKVNVPSDTYANGSHHMEDPVQQIHLLSSLRLIQLHILILHILYALQVLNFGCSRLH